MALSTAAAEALRPAVALEFSREELALISRGVCQQPSEANKSGEGSAAKFVLREEAVVAQEERRFAADGLSYELQYASLYFSRLESLRESVVATASSLWPGVKVLGAIKDAKRHERCVAVGTLFKDLTLRASVLKKYAETLDVQVVAALGAADERGVFKVQEIAIPGKAPPPALPTPETAVSCSTAGAKPEGFDSTGKVVAFVSGLRLGSAASSFPRRLQLLRDFLLGNSPCEELRSLARRVCHLVVCGDVCRLPKSAVEAAALDSALKGSDLADLEASLAEGDVFLASLAASLPCTLMPGAQDPSTRALPQLPFHSALFQKAHRFANCKAAPNPHSLSVDGVKMIGSSGQPVTDICALTSLEPLEALSLCAEARCLAPTAPDTLACVPSASRDPFALSSPEGYHVYFAGCQQKFAFKRLSPAPAAQKEASSFPSVALCVPSFSATGELVLLSLGSLEAKTLRFEEA